jgi:hypothetical protein
MVDTKANEVAIDRTRESRRDMQVPLLQFHAMLGMEESTTSAGAISSEFSSD